jgi:hypothetical protein
MPPTVIRPLDDRERRCAATEAWRRVRSEEGDVNGIR